jgi:hypothetical protein
VSTEVGQRMTTVDRLTRHDFGMWIVIPGYGSGYLYAVHDDYNDGYPSRMIVVISGDGSTAAELEFTDSDPAGYPKTMATPCVVMRDEPATAETTS